MLSGSPSLAVPSRICVVGELADDSRVSEAAKVIMYL
jgi:hypothetical protein